MNVASQPIISPSACLVYISISNIVLTSPGRTLVHHSRICILCALSQAQYFKMTVVGLFFVGMSSYVPSTYFADVSINVRQSVVLKKHSNVR